MKSRITPCLWFAREAEDAATFYTWIGAISRYGDGAPPRDRGGRLDDPCT